MNLQRAYKDIQSGEIKINRYNKKQNQKSRKINNENYYEKEDNEDRFYFPNNMEGDFELFGFNFSKLSPKFKNVIGFGLILLVFICVLMGLKWINEIRGQKDNKKKKNKKEKKKQK